MAEMRAEENKMVKMVAMGDMLEWNGLVGRSVGRLGGTDVMRKCTDCVIVRRLLG